MNALLQTRELEHTAELIAREAQALLEQAELVHQALDAAAARGDAQGLHIATAKLARIARQFTRAQANLVYHEDPRYAAARAVVGYCDEADEKSPWAAPAAPLLIGVAS